MEFTSLNQMFLLGLRSAHLMHVKVQQLEFNTNEFSCLLKFTPNVQTLEINGVFYRYKHLYAKELPKLENLTTLYFKNSDHEILQHFKKCPEIGRLFLGFPKQTRLYDQDPRNYDESDELLKHCHKLKVLTIINPLQIFKRDISKDISFQLTEFLISAENICSHAVLKNLHHFMHKQKMMQSLVMENILTLGFLKLISEEMQIKKLELYGLFLFPRTTKSRWENVKKNTTVKHLVIACKVHNPNCIIDKVMALFESTQILELKFLHLTAVEMSQVALMQKLQKISFSECSFTHICVLPTFLNEIVFDSIPKNVMTRILDINRHIDKLTILRKFFCFSD